MKPKSKILSYILRTWEEEPTPAHPALKMLPPFFWELLSSSRGAFTSGIIIYIALLITCYSKH